VKRVQLLFGERDAHTVEAFALVPVRLVRHRRAEHPEGDRLAVDLGFQGRLELRDLLRGLARQLAEVALDGEAPQLGDVPVAVRRVAERERLVELGEIGEALVDRAELELLLVAGVVEVELLVQLRDEAVGPLAEAVEVGGVQRRSLAGQSRLRITRCAKST
jgi:hypothetical protein